MSLPSSSQNRFGLPLLNQHKKPIYRCLPEIHASRLAISGSLRPKLGLLLLSVVLLVSLCFILIPILSKISFNGSKRKHNPSIPLISVFEDISSESQSSVLFSPDVLVSSVALLSSTSSPKCGVFHKNSSSVFSLNKLLTLRSEATNNTCRGADSQHIGNHAEMKEAVNDWLKKSEIKYQISSTSSLSFVVSSLKLNLQISSLTSSESRSSWIASTGLHIPLKFTKLKGDFKVAYFPSYTIVQVNSFIDDLEIYFLLPRMDYKHRVNIQWEDFDLSDYGTSQLELLLPLLNITSKVNLSKSLQYQETEIWQFNSLQLSISEKEDKSFNEQKQTSGIMKETQKLSFNHSFIIMVKESLIDSPLMIGRIMFEN